MFLASVSALTNYYMSLQKCDKNEVRYNNSITIVIIIIIIT